MTADSDPLIHPVSPEKPPSKRGPKLEGGLPRVSFSTWTDADTKAAIEKWTEESRAVHPKWNAGRTLQAMVIICKGLSIQPVAPGAKKKKGPAASKPTGPQ